MHAVSRRFFTSWMLTLTFVAQKSFYGDPTSPLTMMKQEILYGSCIIHPSFLSNCIRNLGHLSILYLLEAEMKANLKCQITFDLVSSIQVLVPVCQTTDWRFLEEAKPTTNRPGLKNWSYG